MKYAQPTTTSSVVMIEPGIQLRPRERRVGAAEELADQEPPDPRAGVDHRQDEERLEHDREVVPVVHQARACPAAC